MVGHIDALQLQIVDKWTIRPERVQWKNQSALFSDKQKGEVQKKKVMLTPKNLLGTKPWLEEKNQPTTIQRVKLKIPLFS